jgi:hypothetical protein
MSAPFAARGWGPLRARAHERFTVDREELFLHLLSLIGAEPAKVFK